MSTRYARTRVEPDHPLAPASGEVQPHRLVLFEKLGSGEHPCHWCGSPLTWQTGRTGGGHGSIVVDHLDNDGRNNAPENLVPSCHRCNTARGKGVPDGEPFVVAGGVRNRAAERTCDQCGSTFLAALKYLRKDPVRFCSSSCRMRYTLAHRDPAEVAQTARKSTCLRWNVKRGKACVCGGHG